MAFFNISQSIQISPIDIKSIKKKEIDTKNKQNRRVSKIITLYLSKCSFY